MSTDPKIRRLLEKGASIPNPATVEIGPEVAVERIAGEGVVLYSGTRIHGAKTLIMPGVKLGGESPVTILDCQLGPRVELKGGFFTRSVCLEKASLGSAAQVREGCLLEEEANGAHAVGLKQTILFPFVTLGSLINFCDCLLAGGTSRKNHTEVGSSYIHFNYTPNQDKATPSLIGDVPRGVMLNQPPIFLGGQGGIVGPTRIGYGTVISAGTIYRGDCPEGGKLLGQTGNMAYEANFHMGFYGDIRRRIYNNIIYLANLLALRQWYILVRRPFFAGQEGGGELYAGARDVLELAIGERLNRFRGLAEKMAPSIAISERILSGARREALVRQKREFMEKWPVIEACFTDGDDATREDQNRSAFLAALETRAREHPNYLQTIQNLDEGAVRAGTDWLRGIVDTVVNRVLDCLPTCRGQ
ncbi:MAG: UDP-N-acetylglucosamine pyrophosphorylase [Pseudomonadota bacterium]|nr:UDP-N-acetylglucosamine pyrophosphorylase [Pseudomonadota bacterium]